MQSETNSLFERDNSLDSNSYMHGSHSGFNSTRERRAFTAPPGPLSQYKQFKRVQEFALLQQFVLSCNQLIHKSQEKYDIESEDGQLAFRKYLKHLEALFPAFNAVCCDRNYRNSFSKAYSVLYHEGELCYLTEIWDSAQEGFLLLWVNGEKYSFSQEVLSLGSKLVANNYQLQLIIKGVYIKILQQVNQPFESILKQITLILEQFDVSWTAYEEKYIKELMNVENQAKEVIVKAIELQKILYTEQISNKLKFKLGTKSPFYYEIRNKLINQISKINSVANEEGKGRDDLHHEILLEAEGILRKITPQQSKAIRFLAEKIKSSFLKIRQILRKYDTYLDQIDPQLRNNQDLVQALMQYQSSWEKGKTHFSDGQKLKIFVQFTNMIETASDKYESFKEMLQCRDAAIFMIIPSLIVLKTLDQQSKYFLQYFLSQGLGSFLHIYETMQKQFQQWKTVNRENYLYFNIIQKQLMGIELNEAEQVSIEWKNYHSMVGKIKQLSMSIQRLSPMDWNGLLEAALIDS